MDTPATLAPWITGDPNTWTNADRAVVLCDMASFVPAEARSERFKAGRWRVFSYEAGGLSGTMIYAVPEAKPPVVRVPLPVRGPHAISVGLFSSKPDGACRAWLRLSGDRCALPRDSQPAISQYWNIREVFYRVADLEGQTLEIGPQPGGIVPHCGVAFVKLIPLTDGEAAALRRDREDRSHRNLAASCDGYSFIDLRGPTTIDEVLAEVEIFRDTDFGTLLLHLGGADQVTYPSAVGSWFAQGIDVFPLPGQRHFAHSVRTLAEKGINPTKTIIDGAHDLGMKVHVGIRPALWGYYAPHTDVFQSPFYRDNPQWRLRDKDGLPVARMSWAVPEVRRHLLDVLREAIAFGADGAHIVFNRGFPMVLYEPAFCELFRQRYGEDPLRLEEVDSRIQDLRREIVATFMRELRVLLDEEQARRGDGRRLELSVCTLGIEEDNLRYAVDLRRLVREGLVDEVYPYKYGFGESKRVWDMDYFNDACRSAGAKVFPMISVYEAMEAHVRDVLPALEAGADGLSIWDVALHFGNIDQWPTIARLGRADELRRRLDQGFLDPHGLRVHRLGEDIMDGRFPIFWGG